jgi:hypothetical protein
MLKFIKRLMLLLLALAMFLTGALFVYINSENFASPIASLRCSLSAASANDYDTYKKSFGLISYAQLRRDPFKGVVYLYWLADAGESEDGLQRAMRLKESVSQYSGIDYRDYETRIRRSFDRQTLEYRREFLNQNNQITSWMTRKCVLISDDAFERLRVKSADATKAKQKI